MSFWKKFNLEATGSGLFEEFVLENIINNNQAIAPKKKKKKARRKTPENPVKSRVQLISSSLENGKQPIDSNHITNIPRRTESNNVSIKEDKEEINSHKKIVSKKDSSKNDLYPYDIAKTLSANNSLIAFENSLYQYDKNWGYYKGLYNSDEAERCIRQAILDENTRKIINSYKVAEIIKCLNAYHASSNNTVFSTSMNKEYINFRNGILKISTGERLEHTPNLYFVNYVNADYPFYNYNNECQGKYFKKFINDICNGDKELNTLLQEVLGLVISDIRNMKISIFFYGPAHSGKSLLIDVMRDVIGEQFCSNVSFKDLTDRFRTACLIGKKLNTSAETSEECIKTVNLNRFKELTGNDPCLVEQKFQQAFTFRNNALLLFAGNSLPNLVTVDANSFFQRILIIPFTNSIPREKQDLELKEKLLAEKSFIVSYAVEGLRRLISNGCIFSKCETSAKIKRDYMVQHNSFEQFKNECLEFSPDGYTFAYEMENAYLKYCSINGLKPIGKTKWHNVLKNEYNCKYDKKNTKRANRHAFFGIIIKENFDLIF